MVAKFYVQSRDLPSQDERVGKYLIYDINEGLSVISKKTHNHLGIVLVRENVLDQGGALVRGKMAVDDQELPRRNAITT